MSDRLARRVRLKALHVIDRKLSGSLDSWDMARLAIAALKVLRVEESQLGLMPEELDRRALESGILLYLSDGHVHVVRDAVFEALDVPDTDYNRKLMASIMDDLGYVRGRRRVDGVRKTVYELPDSTAPGLFVSQVDASV